MVPCEFVLNLIKATLLDEDVDAMVVPQKVPSRGEISLTPSCTVNLSPTQVTLSSRSKVSAQILNVWKKAMI